MFAEFLHIRPWEMHLLTVKEFDALVVYVDGIKNRQNGR